MMAIFTAMLGAALWIIGIWASVFGFFFRGFSGFGPLLLLGGTALILLSIVVFKKCETSPVRSFWVFDRPEKDRWEDVDRVLRR